MNLDETTRDQASEQLTEIVLQDWIQELIREEIQKFEERQKYKAFGAKA